MSYHHSHFHSGAKNLKYAIFITAIWFVIELAGGLYSNSLALLADAAHMMADFAALGLSYFALKISARPATAEKTYGFMRAEILAALANGISLILIALYIFYESYHRLWLPPDVKSLPMLLVASTGLLANLVTAKLLHRSHKENLNLRAAFLHVMGDALGSAGAIVAGIFMLAWQWYWADPVVSIIVGALILYSSWELVSESVDVLLEGVPHHLDIANILQDLNSIPGVVSVHDLHVWSIASATTAMSCHIVMKSETDHSNVLENAIRIMRTEYGVEHTTIQMEVKGWAASGSGNCKDGTQCHQG
jgi:cobalt-zinc-cadmium efflux system protein